MEHPEETQAIFCRGLQDYAQLMDPDPSTGLCHVCEKIDFTFNGEPTCRHIEDRAHFHIGSLAEIRKKEFCPGCRLVLSAVSFQNIGEDVFENVAVSIYRAPIDILSEEDAIRSSQVVSGRSTPIIYDTGDFHNRVYVADRKTKKYGYMGAIVRMSPHRNDKTASFAATDLKYNVRADGCGRIVPPHVNMSLLKDWLEFCNSHHDICSISATDFDQPKNIRLIDVEDWRIVNTTTREDFLALSYVWGNVAPLLNEDNWKRYRDRNALTDVKLPRTISDAIELTRIIGKKYLWVDSLCIIQDNASDKHVQLGIMDNIYKSATIVIVAAAGTDAHAGIPGINGLTRNSKQQVESVKGTQFVTTQMPVRTVVSGTKWASRGWTYQEAFFARRALVFTENEVYWTCNVAEWRESLRTESTTAVFNIPQPYSERVNRPFHQYGPNNRTNKCPNKQYCDLVSEFSLSKFSVESDVFYAFAGILESLAAKFPSGYIWATPYESLDAAILWYHDPTCERFHVRYALHEVRDQGRIHRFRFPSWSWLSCNADISFVASCGNWIVSDVIWKEPTKREDWTHTSSLSDHGLTTIAGRTGIVREARDDSAVKLTLPSSLRTTYFNFGLLRLSAYSAILDIEPVCIRTPAAEDGELELHIDRGRRVTVSIRAASGKASGKASERELHCDQRVRAVIRAPSGEEIGQIDTTLPMLNGAHKSRAEFVQLSSNIKTLMPPSGPDLPIFDPDTFDMWNYDGDCKERLSSGCYGGALHHVKGCKHISSYNIMMIEESESIAYRRGLTSIRRELWDEIETVQREIILG